MDSIKKENVYDMGFIGSGISTAFTLLRFIEKLEDVKIDKPIKIAVIEKSKDFYMGLPYGLRSGFSSLLITSLEDFLPQPELEIFIAWLSKNKSWLLEEFKKDGGTLSKEWLKNHKEEIDNNQWKRLFIPRRFFGEYIKGKVLAQIEKGESMKIIKVDHISMSVVNVVENEDSYQVISDEKRVRCKKVILAIGSPPPRKIWATDFSKSDESKELGLFSNPYAKGINSTLDEIDTFLSKRKTLRTNVLIIGANASALEMLYKINDNPGRAGRIDKFYFMSTLGMVPDSVVDEAKKEKFSPYNLFSLQNSKNLTAEQIVKAAFADLDVAEDMDLGAATTVKPISEAFAKLLGSLDNNELENFACFAGNEIGRRQRCAGQHYSNTVSNLKKEGRFEHIAGRFIDLVKQVDGTFKFRYLKTDTRKEELHDDSINIVINCIGSELLDNENISTLYKNLMNSGLCTPNKSYRGFYVNNEFEAVPNFHILGPLLAGNLIDGKAVWHVEHCGRIVWLSNLLSKKLSDHFLKPMLKNKNP
ncbi:FAD/NAD(P)-binding protein [Flagellimonas sp. 389]|uniref:FAD/NAD(P)-binding protein n=1 Tax=Flagellimonas sp. 389 TaxID=2835862 RepID=UPI001BD4451C|nr:FAD/NAD(P)-binding protein [Flagellimonas sp. 389]MBS9462209.1 FAD/NAD(P)-binding protein [Flagellimonas sp. 389]